MKARAFLLCLFVYGNSGAQDATPISPEQARELFPPNTPEQQEQERRERYHNCILKFMQGTDNSYAAYKIDQSCRALTGYDP